MARNNGKAVNKDKYKKFLNQNNPSFFKISKDVHKRLNLNDKYHTNLAKFDLITQIWQEIETNNLVSKLNSS